MCDVLIATGEMFHEAADLELPGYPEFTFARAYTAFSSWSGSLGHGWRHSWEISLLVENGRITLRDGLEPEVSCAIEECDGRKFPKAEMDRGYSVIRLTHSDGRHQVFIRDISTPSKWFLERFEDANGNWANLQYVRDRLIAIRDSSGRMVDFQYSFNGLLTAVVATHADMSERMSYQQDNRGRLVSVTDGRGFNEGFQYEDDLIVSHTNPAGLTRYFSYDVKKRCIFNWYDGGFKLRHLEFAADGKSVLLTDSYGYRELYRLDDNGREIASVDPLHRKTFRVYAADGELASDIRPDGVSIATAFVDDSMGSHTSIDARGSATTFELDGDGRSRAIHNAAGQSLEIVRDEKGNTTELRAPENAIWRFEYDSRGSLTKWTSPNGEWIARSESGSEVRLWDVDGVRATYNLDRLGNVVAHTDALGRTTRYEYSGQDLLNTMILPDGRSTGWEYDPMGRITRIVDSRKRATSFEYGPFGTVSKATYPDGRSRRASIDLEGNITEVVNCKGEITRIDYDAAFRKTRMVFFDGREDRYQYDIRNRISKYIDPCGITETLSYDETSNLTAVKWPDDFRVEYSFDQLGNLSRVQSVSDSESPDPVPQYVAFTYNGNGYVSSEEVNKYRVGYVHDASGNLARAEDSLGRKLEYESRRGLVRSIVDNGDRFVFDYTDAGELRLIRMPNGMLQRLHFDVNSRLVRRELYSRSERLVAWRDFSYDDVDRLVTVLDWRTGRAEFQYDDADRLVRVLREGGRKELYAYDLEGNLVTSPSFRDADIGPGNRWLRGGNRRCEYDSYGSVVRIQNGNSDLRFEYNRFNQLSRVYRDGALAAEYEYDLLSRRTRKKVPGEETRFYYHANLIRSMISSRHGQFDFLYVPDTFIPLSQHGPKGRLYYSFDQIGAPTEAWNEAGDLVAAISTDAYGGTRVIQGASEDIPLPFCFPGQFVDSETGLHYNRFRYYWPQGGRFLSHDPMGLSVGLNFYTYPQNPLTWIDPLGLTGVSIKIKCFPSTGSFTPCEQKALMMKVAVMDAKLKAQPRKQRCTHCRKNKQKKYFKKKCKGAVPKGYQVDHIQELQLGGPDKCCSNLMAIPARPNASCGAQIHQRLNELGSKAINGISIAAPGCDKADQCKSDPTRRAKDPKDCEEPDPIVC